MQHPWSKGDAVKYDPSLDSSRTYRDNIRQLGFDPDQLTLEEQRELLELDARLSAASDPKRRDLVAR